MKTAIALGNFDGVHLAHRRIIENTVSFAEKNGAKSVVYTFAPHPRQLLSGDFYVLMQPEVKAEIIKGLGIDEVVFQNTTPEFLATEPEKFVTQILVKKLGAVYVAVGYDYRFGKNGAGNTDTLKALSKKYGFVLDVTDEVTCDGKKVSSTRLRSLIKNGETDKAAELMCAPYTVRGNVVRGNGIGAGLGFRTANILPPKGLLLPSNGVYETSVKMGELVYKSITNVGEKPTFGEGKLVTETFIRDFEGDIYGKTIDVQFGRKIRDEIKFDSPVELSEQIAKDLESLRKRT